MTNLKEKYCWFCKNRIDPKRVRPAHYKKAKFCSKPCWDKYMVENNHLKKHGLSQTNFYHIWASMKQRCDYKKLKRFDRWGGRGITYDKKWKRFENFYEDMGCSFKSGLSLDRIDNNGNYCKENCRWATRLEQARNTRNNRLVSYKGTTQSIFDWEKDTGIKYSTIYYRLSKGWSVEKALTTKTKKNNYGH